MNVMMLLMMPGRTIISSTKTDEEPRTKKPRENGAFCFENNSTRILKSYF
jgi:hypothetical protein